MAGLSNVASTGDSSATSSSVIGDLDDALPPSARAAKAIKKHFGSNKGARAACLALSTGKRLSLAQSKSLFREGRRVGVDDVAMRCIVMQANREGITPDQLAAAGAAALHAGVPAQMVSNVLPSSVTVWLMRCGWRS